MKNFREALKNFKKFLNIFFLFSDTLVSFLFIVLLFITETWSFFTVQVVEQLYVVCLKYFLKKFFSPKDSTSADQQIEIHFDITLPNLACALVTIDLMSQSGDNKDSIKDDVFKQRLDINGKVIEGTKPEKQGFFECLNF